MGQARDPLVGLELQRLQLEETISALQKSLYHWRLWEAEYDGLKEEIAALGDNSTRDDFLRIGREFGGSLVTEYEIKVLLGESQGVNRSQQQVMDCISRRIDYVQQNIKVIEKRMSDAEQNLNKILVIEQPGVINEGLPLTDIVEELDDDGHVISSSTTTPGQAAPQLLDVLKKAGVNGIPQGSHDDDNARDAVRGASSHNEADIVLEEPPRGREDVLQPASGSVDASSETPLNADQSKMPSSVVDSVGPASAVSTKCSKSHDHSTISQKEEWDLQVVAEIDESPEDAALRREMLQYGLEEVGAVVAELELDESGSEFSVEDDVDYLMSDEGDEVEDEYGRTTRRVIDDDYHRQMLELEKELNARSLQNIGPDPSGLPPEVRQELEGSGSSKHGFPEVNGKPAKKKKVSFANDLDITPGPSGPSQPKTQHSVEPPEIIPVQDLIVERAEAAETDNIPEPKPQKRTSLFKTSRNVEKPRPFEAIPTTTSTSAPPKKRPSFNANALPSSLSLFSAKSSTPIPYSQPITDLQESSSPNPAVAKAAPQPRTLIADLIEREVSPENSAPPDPDELDEALHRQEFATEFYKLRNRKVQQGGGFLGEDEESERIVPLDEQESGQPRKKVSRFMAARMK